jgi:ribosomal protein S18 acetylase RimI-like enzyme/catechol 2,3-dioxygenase-like lactoylglutathione lyase family enzyme
MSDTSNLRMRRASLADLPPLSTPPDGFILRRIAREAMTSEDIADLTGVLAASFSEMVWTPRKVREALVSDESVLETCILIDAESGAIAATATARFVPDRYPNSGYLHWVGAYPHYKGKGFGRFVSLAVLHKFCEMGYADAVLETQDMRLPAIHTYLKLGFAPEIYDKIDNTHEARWHAILHPPLGTQPVTQVAFIVEDIDIARHAWARVLNVPVPGVRITTPGFERDLTYRGQPSGAQAKLSFFNLGQVQVELVQPMPETGKSVWDDAKPGVHHLAFRTRNMRDTQIALSEVGVPLVFRGDGPNGSQMAYFDARDQLGIYFEFAEAIKTEVDI